MSARWMLVKLAKLEQAADARARGERWLAEYEAERERARQERGPDADKEEQIGRLIDADPEARAMLLRALYICEPGGVRTLAERAEAERLVAILTEKLRVAHAASGAPGEPVTFYCGWNDEAVADGAAPRTELHPLDPCG